MRIVVIGPVYPYRGGIAHYTTQLSSNLTDVGHEIHIISFQRQYPAWLYPGKSDKDPSQPLIELDSNYLLDPLYPWTWRTTFKDIIEFKPDLIIIPWWTTFWAPAFWALAKSLTKNGYDVCFLIHNVIPHESKPWDRWIARSVLQHGQAHIVQAKNEQERLLEILPDAQPVLCPHPVYNQFRAKPDLSKDLVFQLQGLDKDLPVLLFFGIVRPYKGLKYLVEALSILKSSGTIVQLIIAGEFWEKIEIYEEMIIRLDVYDQVFLFDRYIPDEEVGIFFEEADIFVAPYVDGTQSGTVKIALGFHLPLVVTECISDELIEDSDRVTIVPPKDSWALAEGIKNTIDSGFPERKINYQDNTGWEQLISTIEGIIAVDKGT
ncbi:MAG: glycosyltransferase [Anaerolineales bacterium]|nr:glycosyltransferase [Anaerolineales bacterium]